MKQKQLIRAALAGALALLALAAPTAHAGDRGVGSINFPAAAGDDIGTAPRQSQNRTPGFVVEATGAQMFDLLRRAQGSGTIVVRALGNGSYAATFRGAYVIRLPHDAVAEGQIRFDFQGQLGHSRVLQRGGDLILVQR